MPSCCIKECGARKCSKQPSLTLHRFPVNEILRRKWTDIIGKKNLNPKHKIWYVCSKHFHESSFNRTLGVTRLRDSATPLSSLLPEKNTAKNRKHKMGFSQKILKVDGPVPPKDLGKRKGHASRSAVVKPRKTSPIQEWEDMEPSATMEDDLSETLSARGNSEIKTYFGRCRCCLKYGYLKNMWEEQIWLGEKEVYVEMLIQCFALTWERSDESAERDQICDTCISQLRDANNFKKTIMQSQKTLLKHVDEETDLPVRIEKLDYSVQEYPESEITATTRNNINDPDDPDDDNDRDDSNDMDYEEVEYLEIEDSNEALADHQQSESSNKKKFSLEKYRKKHEKLELLISHKDVAKFKCWHCDEHFSGEYLRHLHILKKHKEKVKNITCEVCGKTFTWRPYYVTHMRRQHVAKFKKFGCQECGKKFFQPFELKEHMLGHTGEKHFPCKVCNKQFISSDSLKRHYYWHKKRDGIQFINAVD